MQHENEAAANSIATAQPIIEISLPIPFNNRTSVITDTQFGKSLHECVLERGQPRDHRYDGVSQSLGKLVRGSHGLEDISREIETNLTGTVRMVNQFLPHLESQGFAAIVNVSSGLAFVPLPIAPIYCAAKAGVHSFTQSLRVQLKNTRIKVLELAPPMTRTPLFAGDIRADDVKGIRMMDVSKMVGQAIRGLERIS